MKCLFCKKEFKPKSIKHTYCSEKCKARDYRRRFPRKNNGRDKRYYIKHREEIRKRSKDWPSYGHSGNRYQLNESGRERKCILCRRDNGLIVHHRDRDRGNNSLSNLVWLCAGCHHLVHNYILPKKKLDIYKPRT